MTRLVSVVTAVHQPSVKYLPDVYESLLAQQMPVGWDWQWIVQEDGTTGTPLDVLPDDPRISFATGRPLGQGVARTFALSRATGELVKVLDSDDQLTAGALSREVAVLEANPDIGWTTCRVLDLLPDGSTVGFPGDPVAGPITRGSVLDGWLRNNYRANVHPATMAIRRDLLLMVGGWMALPAGEDTGMMLAVATVADGYFIEEAGLLYRKWPGQVTADPAHTAPAEWTARNEVIRERAEQLQTHFPLGWASPRSSAISR